MRLWTSCLFFLSALIRINCQTKVTDVDLKYLSATEDATDDVLTIYFQGKKNEDISAYKYANLQIFDITSLNPVLIERNLETDTITKLGESMIFIGSFPYKSEGESIDIGDLLQKKIKLQLFLKDSKEGNTLLYGEIDIDLTGQDEFPVKSDHHYIEDTINVGGRWLRFNKPNTVTIEAIDAPVCIDDDVPCYIYETTASTNTYYQCVDVTVTDVIYLCSTKPSELKQISDTGDTPTQIILDHTAGLKVDITNTKGAHIDLVINKPIGDPATCIEVIQVDEKFPCDEITFASNTFVYTILIVTYDDSDNYFFTSHKAINHNLGIKLLNDEIFEASWDHDASAESVQHYFASLFIEDTVSQQIYVDCGAITGKCHSYFVNIAVNGKYHVTLQNLDEFDETEIITVRSSDVEKNDDPLNRKPIVIREETIETKVNDKYVTVSVCFEYLKNISMADSHYEFIVINSIGQWKKETEVDMKTDSYACFNSLELPFKEISKAFVLLRNTKDSSILASGEVKLYTTEAHAGDDSGNTSSKTVWIIVGTSAGFLACLVALVALIYTKIIKRGERDDGIQYPLQRNIIENSKIIQGLDNPASTI